MGQISCFTMRTPFGSDENPFWSHENSLRKRKTPSGERTGRIGFQLPHLMAISNGRGNVPATMKFSPNPSTPMPEKPYDHARIELKWFEQWQHADFYKAEENSSKPKFYVLEMLPYPSGTLHIGHIRNYSIGDALARYKWMRGFNVLHPMGWDAFGLPAENAAIANNRHPREWTLHNIEAMKKTHRRFGFSYDWDREVATCDPAYYRWNQWFFLKMLERGLAYRKRALLNWCPTCATVLANEQVVDGCCWRHETTPVEQRALAQWFFRITNYAQQLLDDLNGLEGGWPERVIT